MECSHIEELLSEYLEGSLSEEEAKQVGRHLSACVHCSELLETMKHLLSACRSFPNLDPNAALTERILQRTSGRGHGRTLRKLWNGNILVPVFTPRFALGTLLALLFAFLSTNLMIPRVSAMASALSPEKVIRQVDLGVRQVYGEGLKVYDRKNEWQAQLTFFADNVFNKLNFMIEQLGVPSNDDEQERQENQKKDKTPDNRSSIQLLSA